MSNPIRVAACYLALIGLMSCGNPGVRNEKANPEICTEDWFQYVEQRLITSDRQGHGPDIGSLEWKTVVEFKLGVRGKTHVPSPESLAWCEFIESELEKGG